MISRRGLSPAHFEALEQGAADQFDEVQKKVAGERTHFFEQIALLSGGAIVLSVSLLSTLFGKVLLHGIVALLIGWLALLGALLAALSRTLRYQPYMMEVSMAHYMRILANKKIAFFVTVTQGGVVMSTPDEEGRTEPVSAKELKQEAEELYRDSNERKKTADKLLKHVQRLEKIALNSFWIGVLLLTVFAGLNVLKAAVLKPPADNPPASNPSK